VNGLLLLDKPEGITSAEAVRRVKARLPRQVKVGHLGTLDPFATGLLPLCLGEATKIAQFLNVADKAYTGAIQLGWATDTGDRTGTETARGPVPAVDDATLARVAAQWQGSHLQRPPMYSAIKQAGVPLYRLARRGIEVEREARPVRIDGLTLASEPGDRLRFALACSKGTYVRVLAEDIGRVLGAPAHLSELRRTGFGPFSITQAVSLDTWHPRDEAGVVPIREALAHLPSLSLDAAAANAARQGKAALLTRLPAAGADATGLVLLDPDGVVAAVLVTEAGAWRFGRVLGAPQALHTAPPVLATDG
jgi:tRNA pseudouridine55 synthase